MEKSDKNNLSDSEKALEPAADIKKPRGVFLTHCQIVAILVFVVFAIVSVGLLAGFVGRSNTTGVGSDPENPQDSQESSNPHDSQESSNPHDSQESSNPHDSQESSNPHDSQESSNPHDSQKSSEGSHSRSDNCDHDDRDHDHRSHDDRDHDHRNHDHRNHDHRDHDRDHDHCDHDHHMGDHDHGSVRQEPWLDPFLPEYIYPVHYDLYQYPDFYFEAATYTGSITIEIRVVQDSRHILIHIKDMTVTSTEVQDAQFTPLSLNRTFAYDPNQYWVIELDSPILAGSTVHVSLDFTGRLDNGIVGYYKSTYVNSDTGSESWLATSKFQPSDSRKAFPNFDEPRYKATYSVTLRHWANFTALGNMQILSEEIIDPIWTETTFEETPVMSSYLVCFIVCDFLKEEDTLETGTPITVWAQPDKIDQVDYALAMGKSIMDSLESLFQMEFHLPKLDNLAVPDYPSGATEHWGLITYRVSRVLYDPAQVSDKDKQSVLFIVAHEMVHNYFGNVITCKWWDDLWLNEAFAVYYEYKESDKADPTINAAGQFVVVDQQPIMESDGLSSSRPLLVEINTPNDANAAFDGITYSKGASMLRMMEGFLTESVFDQGARNMLNTFSFQSVVTQDLWDSMQAAVTNGLNVTAIMRPWVYQSGLPVIDVTIEGSNLRATQRRFMMDPSADPTQPPSPYNYKWYVPLNYLTETGGSDLLWLNGVDSITFLDPTGGVDWIKFNTGSYMYYRVNYDSVLWSRITQQINTDYTAFTAVDRSDLLDDGLNIARAGQAPYSGILDLTLYLADEVALEPWRTAENGLEYVSHMLHYTSNFTRFRNYIQTITTKRMNQLQVKDGGTHEEKINREDIIDLSCHHGYSECLQNTSSFFADWLIDDTLYPVPLNIRRMVYAYGMQTIGDNAAFDTMWTRYSTSTSGQEADNILYGLCHTTSSSHVATLLQYSMDESKIRSQDFFTLIDYLGYNEGANSQVWDWARVNYDAIVARFGLDNRSLGSMIPDIVSGYSTPAQLQEVEDFYALYPDPGTGAQSRAESLDSIQNNIKWRERSEQELVNWLILQGF